MSSLDCQWEGGDSPCWVRDSVLAPWFEEGPFSERSSDVAGRRVPYGRGVGALPACGGRAVSGRGWGGGGHPGPHWAGGTRTPPRLLSRGVGVPSVTSRDRAADGRGLQGPVQGWAAGPGGPLSATGRLAELPGLGSGRLSARRCPSPMAEVGLRLLKALDLTKVAHRIPGTLGCLG